MPISKNTILAILPLVRACLKETLFMHLYFRTWEYFLKEIIFHFRLDEIFILHIFHFQAYYLMTVAYKLIYDCSNRIAQQRPAKDAIYFPSHSSLLDQVATQKPNSTSLNSLVIFVLCDQYYLFYYHFYCCCNFSHYYFFLRCYYYYCYNYYCNYYFFLLLLLLALLFMQLFLLLLSLASFYFRIESHYKASYIKDHSRTL